MFNVLKAKDIKKALKYLANYKCEDETSANDMLYNGALNIINNYENRINQLQNLLDNRCDICIQRERQKTAIEILRLVAALNKGYESDATNIEIAIKQKYNIGCVENDSGKN